MNWKQFLNKRFLLSFIIFILGVLVITSVCYGYYIAFLDPTVSETFRQGHSVIIDVPNSIKLFSLIPAAILAYFIPRPKDALVFTVVAIIGSLIGMMFLAKILSSR